MKHIAITGGIGSGKSYFCRELEKMGVEVYDSDASAKRLMASDEALKAALRQLVGKGVYSQGVLQKRVLAEFILQSEDNRQAVDDIVHPAVATDFLRSGLAWLESAILFDSGFYRRIPFDFIVCVSAPVDVRVERVVERDRITPQKARQWIESQWPQREVEARADFVIVNDGWHDLHVQALQLLKAILVRR